MYALGVSHRTSSDDLSVELRYQYVDIWESSLEPTRRGESDMLGNGQGCDLLLSDNGSVLQMGRGLSFQQVDR